ncbi:hypothetical protein GJW-30_1_00805 [Variibacter gotjawalensis]|uniref:Uncharacterized protein n=1 Tax=Variibacter gotjawalensis TaxID=1333996 RepID=A0A0S3PQU5_9BRAD|nr:hypothetical protein [Variibacter gotjawalensis]NIK48582.1 hypothetical protein [Variibacter gotjawalensis]RZS50447.1 hypothetical protein EV661_2911 [Variibacter gotjawalensis]BAT58281.1 hypothetical protein GJW-30_1_00805 [Variibacter gotjawalensis]
MLPTLRFLLAAIAMACVITFALLSQIASYLPNAGHARARAAALPPPADTHQKILLISQAAARRHVELERLMRLTDTAPVATATAVEIVAPAASNVAKIADEPRIVVAALTPAQLTVDATLEANFSLASTSAFHIVDATIVTAVQEATLVQESALVEEPQPQMTDEAPLVTLALPAQETYAQPEPDLTPGKPLPKTVKMPRKKPTAKAAPVKTAAAVKKITPAPVKKLKVAAAVKKPAAKPARKPAAPKAAPADAAYTFPFSF